MPSAQVGESAAGRLITLLDSCPPDRLGSLAAQVMIDLGLAETVSIWLIDHGFTYLTDLVGNKEAEAMQGSILGRVATSEEAVIHAERAYLPLARRGQVIGVIEIRPASPDALADLFPMAIAVSNALLATGLISDVVERSRGATNLSLPATIQHRNLPLTSYADEEVELGSRLEPAYDIAGDAIDYAANPEGIHLALFDAVGHGLRATTLSTWAVSTYRLMRRKGAALAEMIAAIDEVVADNAESNEFVTGIMILVKPAEGVVEIANAGHLPPLLIRDGAAHFMDGSPVQVPFGLGVDSPTTHLLPSQPDDVIFLYSDGVIQARNADLAMWGEQTFSQQVLARTSEGLSVGDVCRQILSSVITWSDGNLADDASIVALRRKG
ncbi:MAG TPA: PP2C family protein-serine/threonine phosphatase [Acidimicrobiia bacterium]